jgi:ribosomal protein L44E
VVKENVIKRVMASLKCSVCQQRYEPDNVTVLGQQEDLWFLKVFCPACHTQYLVAAVIKEGKAPEVITDLTEAEWDKFKNAVGLTADEVLDMHNFLKDFDGDFSRLFSRE